MGYCTEKYIYKYRNQLFDQKFPKEGKKMKVRKERIKKEMALIMGFVMIAVMFSAVQTGSAYPHYSESNAWGIRITQDTLTSTYYPGEQNVAFRITIANTAGGSETDNAQIDSCNLYIQTGTVRDENGNAVTSPISNWDNDKDEWGGNIANGGSHSFGVFQFDIADNAQPGTYNLTIDLSFTDHDGTPSGTQHFTGYVLFTIANNIAVSDAYPDLYAGQTFTDLYIDVSGHWNNVDHLYLNLSNIPDGITFDNPSGWTSTHTLPATLGYKVTVAKDMPAGVYTMDYTVQYYNPDNEWCTETGTLHVTVGFTPVIEAQFTGNNITVTQGDASIPAMGVTFTNTGNVPLRDITIKLDYDGNYFYSGTTYYEGAEGSGDQNPVQVTDVHIDSLDVGATAQGSWFVALNSHVQAGQHRLLFDWTATYYDNGSTGNPTSYVDVSMQWWDDDWDDSTPMVPEIRMGGPWISPWIAGPYVMVGVVDNHPDFSAGKIENRDTGDDYIDLSSDNLVNVEIGSRIHNLELSRFTDLKATLQVGNGTPFLNPLDHSATTVENDVTDSDNVINPDGYANMYWYVDIDPNTHPNTYSVNITLSGRNVDTTEYMTTTIQAVVEIRGFGPELVVDGVTTGNITPGQIFYLNLTVTNKGDDTARDVFVSIPGHIGYNWDVIDGFVSAISSNNANKVVVVPNGVYENESITIPGTGHLSYEYIEDGSLNKTQSKNTEFSGVTLEKLNITDAKDIVDLALYIEGVFNSPTAEIWLLKADNVAPGQSIHLSFKMKTNVNMVEGRPYDIKVVMSYTDSHGNGPNPNLRTQDITIRTTNPGTAYHSMPTQEKAGKLTNQQMMILLVIILVILAIIAGVALAGRGGKKKKEEPVYGAPAVEESYEPAVTESPETEEPAPEEITGDEPGFTLEEKEEEGESSF
jgi:hypothetical protein